MLIRSAKCSGVGGSDVCEIDRKLQAIAAIVSTAEAAAATKHAAPALIAQCLRHLRGNRSPSEEPAVVGGLYGLLSLIESDARFSDWSKRTPRRNRLPSASVPIVAGGCRDWVA